MKERNKAYFVDTESSWILEISYTKRKLLEKKHPNWTFYDLENNPKELLEVFSFFKENGKLLSHPFFKNSFIGFTI